MNPKNDDVRDLTNATAWHKAGYFGQRVTIANGERWSLAEYNPDGLCSAPLREDVQDEHGKRTAQILHEFVPQAHIVQIPFGPTAWRERAYDYIKEHGISLATYSEYTLGNDSTWEPYLDSVRGICTFFICGGNDGDDDYNGYIQNETSVGVGAASILYSSSGKQVLMASYSSESEHLDFCGFTGLWTADGSRFTGTSCATPALCGLMALVQDFFIDKTGRPLSRDSLYQFMSDHAVDIQAEGFDTKSGFGYVVLPNPEDIKIEKYQEVKPMSKSPLTAVTYLSPNRVSPRTHAIDTITIHCVVGQWSAETIGNYFMRPAVRASCNYGIGTDGRVVCCVPEGDRSWCSSSEANDDRAITIECASATVAPYRVYDKVLDTLITLCADICQRNGIKRLLWKGDKSLIGQVDKQNMTVHRWFANKACPGDYLYNLHGHIADQVNHILEEAEKEESKMEETKIREIVRDEWAKITAEMAELPASDWAERAVDCLKENGISDGTRPQSYVTRQEILTMLHRMQEGGK